LLADGIEQGAESLLYGSQLLYADSATFFSAYPYISGNWADLCSIRVKAPVPVMFVEGGCGDIGG
jgi:hypothetical protein